jgi:hypothetical protein
MVLDAMPAYAPAAEVSEGECLALAKFLRDAIPLDPPPGA